MKDHVMMAPYRLKASLAATLREVTAKRGCSITFAIQDALKDWLEKHGVQDPDEAENPRRLEALKVEREAKAAAAREQAVRDAEKRLIDHLEHWRRHGGGKPYTFLAGRTCPPGFEDVIRGTVNREEEI
jgi:hypothetical protein